MSFIGKVYKFESQENFDGFLKAIGLPDELIAKFLEYKPTSKLTKDGNTYTYTTEGPEGTSTASFESGVEFDELIKGIIPVKTTYTVDGNVVTQVIKSETGTATFKREYSDNKYVVTITATTFDGVAKRFYSAES